MLCKAFLLSILLAGSAYAGTFVFESNGKQVEGFVVAPAGAPKALVFYFHRSIEDRNAVLEWAKLLGPMGYEVAGYTRTGASNRVEEAETALNSLRARKELSALPVIAMGASLGTGVSAELFAADPQIRGLILIVPGEPDACAQLAKTNGRPVLLIQAQNDEIVDPGRASSIKKCLPKNGESIVLPGTTHKFPPSQISPNILSWLSKIFPAGK